MNCFWSLIEMTMTTIITSSEEEIKRQVIYFGITNLDASSELPAKKNPRVRLAIR